MKIISRIIVLVVLLSMASCKTKQKPSGQGEDGVKFASSMVNFTPYKVKSGISGYGNGYMGQTNS